MILSILGSRPRHEDLLSLTAINGVQVIDLPPSSAERSADFTVICGDGHTLAIHYHSPHSLLGAIRTGTLMPALVTLKQATPWAYLLIGGIMSANADGKVRNNDGKSSGWLWSAVQGVLLTAQEMGVGVLHLPHADSVPATLESLAKRDRGPIKAVPQREAMFCSPGELVLMALPGIGEGKAEALLRYCGDSAAHALMALTSEYTGAPSIGPETRRKVRQALGLDDGFAIVPTKETDLSLHEKAEIAQSTSGPRRAA
jgi:hypothetical protein